MATFEQTRSHKVFPAERDGDVLIVVPQGDAAGFREMTVNQELARLVELLEGEEFRHVVADLGADIYFGSIIIGCLSRLGQTAEQGGGRMVFCNGSDDMRAILRAMNFEKRWPHLPSREKAIAAVRRGSEVG